MRQRSTAHHQGDARDTPERVVDTVHLPGDGIRIADKEGSIFRSLGIEGCARCGRPAALAADAGEGRGVGGPEDVGGFLVSIGEEADGVDGDVEQLGRMACAASRFAVQVDEWAEAMGFASDNGYRQRQAERARADEGCWCSAGAEADWELRLQRARPDALSGERRTVFALPLDAGFIAEVEEEVELLGEEFVVELGVVAEERIGLDEGAAADDDLGATLGDEVKRSEVLEDANGIVRAQNSDRRREANVLRARSSSGQQNCGRGGDVLLAVVLANPVDVDAGAIGEFNLLKELVNAFCGELAGRAAGAERGLYETVYSDLHDGDWMSEAYGATHGSDCVRMFQ